MPAITAKNIVLAAADHMDKYGKTNYSFTINTELMAEHASMCEGKRVEVGACCLIGAIGQGYLAVGGKCPTKLPFEEPVPVSICRDLEEFLCDDLHSFTANHDKEQCVEALRNFATTLKD